MHYRYAYNTGPSRRGTRQSQSRMPTLRTVSVCTPMHFHSRSRGAHQVDVILQVTCDAWQACKSNTTPNHPHHTINAYCETRDWKWWCRARRAKSNALTSAPAPVDEENNGWGRETKNGSEHRREGECMKGGLGCVLQLGYAEHGVNANGAGEA